MNVSGPTTATLGMSLQLPLALALDIVLQKLKFASLGSVLLMVLGGWYILVGFVGINISPRPHQFSHAVALPVDDDGERA